MKKNYIKFQRSTNIMGKVTLKQVYELAEKNKGEDRITKSDINQAKKTLGYKDPAPEIKDYMSGGGEVEVGKGGDYIKDLID